MSAARKSKASPKKSPSEAVPARLAHLLVLLEDGAVSFCHYENPRFYAPAEPRWMAVPLLRSIVDHAERNGIALSFLLGRHRLPQKLERLTDRIAHTKIVPQELCEDYRGAIVVLESENGASFDKLPPDWGRNVILRLARRDLGRLGSLCASLTGRYGRLSLHLRELEYYTRSDLARYEDELHKLADELGSIYARGNRVEINVLTDRMILKQMRNCDAGVAHLTVAPDGTCHTCPGFLSDGEAAIGAFDAKRGVVARPPANIALERGPLCTRCDAWHCKRCVYLSRKLTLEYNVPSEQQCLTAHAERETTRLLLRRLGNMEPFRRMPRLAELNYRDPLELIEFPLTEGWEQPASDDPML